MADEEVRRFGDLLRSARESAGLTIEDVARTTRISGRYITALEEENWEVVPGAVIGRGFVRAVAREVGADPQTLLEAYKRSRGSEEEAAGNGLPETEWRVDLRAGRGRRPVFLGAGVLFLLLLALLWFWPQPASRDVAPDPAAVAGGPPGPPLAEAPEAETEGVEPSTVAEAPPPVAVPVSPAPAEPEPPAPEPEPAPEPREGPVTLKIQAVERVWVRVVADGGENQDRILAPGEQREYQAQETFRVRLGNAASVRLIWNDTALKVPGERGEVLTLQFPEAVESLRP